jgi:NAD+ diphosphatase
MISNQNNFFCETHFIFREDNIMLEIDKTSSPGVLPSETTLRKCLQQQVASDWFAEPELNYSATLIEDSSPDPVGCSFVPLRAFFAVAAEKDCMLAGRAKGLLEWRYTARYCSICGTRLEDDPVQTARVCPKCGHHFFPQIEPAIIVLITDGDRLLLVRHSQRIQNLYACISGFIELGESAEQCVAREVREEVGLEVRNIRYVGSQSWPFPDRLMLAFRAEYAGGDMHLQKEEIAEAHWFKRDALPTIPKPGSVAYRLIKGDFR